LAAPSEISGNAHSAAQSLARFGVWAGWGLTLVGLVEGLSGAAEAIGAVELTSVRRAGLLLRAGAVLFAWLTAGWGIYYFSRFAAAVAIEYLQRLAPAIEQITAQASRALGLLEALAEAAPRRTDPDATEPSPGADRAIALAQIERATRGAQ